MTLSVKDELEEVKIAIRKVSADDLPEEESQYYWDKADLLMDLMSMTASVDDFFEIAEAFSENKGYEYYNLNDVYVHRIESMDNYPPLRLFTDKTDNELIVRLRNRCWMAQDVDVTHFDKSLEKFSCLYTKYLNHESKDLIAVLYNSDLSLFTLHELRLVFEMLISLYKPEDSFFWIERLVAMIEQAKSD